MNVENNTSANELRIEELLALFWAYKFLIIAFTIAAFLLANSIAERKEKLFTSKSTFMFEEIGGGFNSLGNSSLGGLGALLSNNNSSSAQGMLLERAVGREFILYAAEKLSLANDPLFNTILTTENKSESIKLSPAIERTIINNYRSYVELKTTPGGAITILFSHVDPEKAASYSNKLMIAITNLMETEENDKKNIRLNYLSETLANAISDMDETARNVKNYAMKNSFVAENNFINQSLKLDKMRTKLAETKAFEKILGVLVESLEQNKTNSDHYQVLRVKYPLIDDVEFRRILGMSETVSAWTWPDLTTVKSVQITLSDRIQNLGTQIRLIENEAKLYAESAEKFMKLDRQSKVAEATYQILIEQVKSEALAAGFNPKSFRVIEYATTPISPSSPNLFLYQLLGCSLGFILSVTLALTLGLARGVFYTRSYLKSFTPTRVQLRGLAKLRRLSNLSISKLHQKIDNAQLSILQEIEISISNEKIIYLHNSNTSVKSINFARALAEKSSLSNRKIALFDFASSASQKENSRFGLKNIIAEPVSDNLDIFLANKDADVNYFFTDKDLDKKLNKILENYDQIIICAKSKMSFVGLYALKNLNPAIILLCKLKRTRKLDLVKLQNISSPAVLVHD